MATVQLVAGQNLNPSLLKHPFMAKTGSSFFRTGLGEVYLRFWSWLARQLAAMGWRKGNKLIEISVHQELSPCHISQAALRNVLKWSGLTLQNSGRETQWKGSETHLPYASGYRTVWLQVMPGDTAHCCQQALQLSVALKAALQLAEKAAFYGLEKHHGCI